VSHDSREASSYGSIAYDICETSDMSEFTRVVLIAAPLPLGLSAKRLQLRFRCWSQWSLSSRHHLPSVCRLSGPRQLSRPRLSNKCTSSRRLRRSNYIHIVHLRCSRSGLNPSRSLSLSWKSLSLPIHCLSAHRRFGHPRSYLSDWKSPSLLLRRRSAHFLCGLLL
jgi:hypothetical protein